MYVPWYDQTPHDVDDDGAVLRYVFTIAFARMAQYVYSFKISYEDFISLVCLKMYVPAPVATVHYLENRELVRI